MLEDITKETETKNVEQKLTTFTEKLKKFKKTTKLIDLIEAYPGYVLDHIPASLMHQGEFKELKIKIEHPDLSSFTLCDVEDLKMTLISEFFNESDLLVFKDATQASNCIIWLIPSSAASTLETSLCAVSGDIISLREHGIGEVIIDGRQCYPSMQPWYVCELMN